MARCAIIFGSNGPQHTSTLRYAINDVSRMYNTLGGYRCGFKTIRPDNSNDPHVIERCIAVNAQRCTGEDTFLIFFSGHGFIAGGSLWLMLDETDVSYPLTTALDAGSIIKVLRFCKAKHKVLILDCCHAGMVFANSGFKSAGSDEIKTLIGTPTAENTSDGAESFVTLVASDKLEQARELESYSGSFLTNSICDALEHHFEDADHDNDGAIDLTDLKHWLTVRAAQHNANHPHLAVPVPFIFGRERGRLYFTREPGDWPVFEIDDEQTGHAFVALPVRASEDSVWLLGKTPVTNAQYKQFTTETGYPEPQGAYFNHEKNKWINSFSPWGSPAFNHADQPVVCVSLEDAIQFANWLQNKVPYYKLTVAPTKIWDYAGFGASHPSYDKKVWLASPVHHQCNAPAIVTGQHTRKNKTGAVDMFGNVWEWTLKPYRRENQITILAMSELDWIKRNQHIRGGSYLDNLNVIDPFLNAGALERDIETRHADLGFRLACTYPIHELPRELIERVKDSPIVNIHIDHFSNLPRTA